MRVVSPLASAVQRPAPGSESLQVAERSNVESIPAWLYPQVLSLDTPAIAVAWQWLFAKSFHLAISPAILFVTASCVWMIYVADHLLDVRGGAIYSARHRFVRRHLVTFLLIVPAVFGAGAAASFHLSGAIWLGGLELTGAVALYLAAVHEGGDMLRRYFPKEFVIGAVFAVGSSLATWTSPGVARHAWPAIALFAALCTLNCAAIDLWEWQRNHVLLRYPHRMTRWVARHLFAAVSTVGIVAAVLLFVSPNAAVLASLISALLLMAVARGGRSLSPEAARLFADAALLAPAVLLLLR